MNISKERRELSVAATQQEAIASIAFDPALHECLQCAETGLWQVFNQRRRFDPTLVKPITRLTRCTFRQTKRVIATSMEPGDIIRFRLKGCKHSFTIPIEVAMQIAIERDARAKVAARKQQRKCRKAV